MSAGAPPREAVRSPWAQRRRRAEELRERHPFCADLLTLYLALLPAQQRAWEAVQESPPAAAELARWASAGVLPAVVEATAAAGPAVLGEAAQERLEAGTAERALAGWLAGAELEPVDRYLARACLAPALEALGERAGEACSGPAAEDGTACPRCGGAPQLSIIAASNETLVSGPRILLCARCASSWGWSRSVCPACGEEDEGSLTVHAERLDGPVSASRNGDHDPDPVFPHLRVVSCSTCSRYLIEAELERDPAAVPEVDELAALPLTLYASDRGLTKVTPNQMGF